MKISKDTLNFNKEILFGEIGALIGIQLINLVPNAYLPPKLIPFLAVLGAIFGGSLFWLWARVYYKSKEGEYSKMKFFRDIEYFAPASTFFTFAFYYPSLFFATKYFLAHHRQIEFSIIASQIIAFALFLAGINIYRYILKKVFKKNL
jgi:hypothetical protein